MSSSFYTRMAAKTAQLIAKYGLVGTIARYASTATAQTGVVVKGTATATGSFAAVQMPTNAANSSTFDNRLEDGTLVGKTLQYLVIAAASCPFEPRALDEITIGNVLYEVLGCTPINPDGTGLIYQVGLMQK
jgi:hypothetical protein